MPLDYKRIGKQIIAALSSRSAQERRNWTIIARELYQGLEDLKLGDIVGVEIVNTTPHDVGPEDVFVFVDTSAAPGTYTVNLLDDALAGQLVIVKDIGGQADVNNIVMSGGSNTIDGVAASTISTAYGSTIFVFNGTEWSILSSGGGGGGGLSAYEVAVANGFVGTEAQWLDSLVGADGLSAYEVAVANGFVGTEAQWLDSLVGADGAQGIDGLSAYEVAVVNGFVGTEAEWLESLIGVNVVPIENNTIYAGGLKTFTLSDSPYSGYVAVYVNGVRIDKTDWLRSGLVLTILGDLELGDEVTLDFFILGDPLEGGSACSDTYTAGFTQYNDLDMDNDGTQHAYFDTDPALVFDTLAWTNLNSFADVEQDV